MVLFTGGAYQGKKECVMQMYGISGDKIPDGACAIIGKEVRALDHYHLRIRRQLQEGLDPLKELEKLLEQRPDIILLCDEVGAGVIPMEAEAQHYREAVGRCMCEAARRAEAVYRVVCGIALRVK